MADELRLSTYDSARPTWRLQVLGELACQVDTHRIREFGSRKAALLLIRLGLSGSRPVQRDEMASTLWPDDPVGVSRPRLRQALSALRTSLPMGDPILAGKNDLAFDDGMMSVDCVEFERLAREGFDDEALALYQPLLPGWNEPWLAPYRERFESLYAQVIARQSATLTQDGAIELIGQACSVHPLNETLLAAYLKRLDLAGQQARAKQAYEQYLDALDAKGLPGPGSALRAVADRLGSNQRAQPEVADIDPLPIPEPLTKLFGRTDAVERLTRLLQDGRRLVTATGIGGIGKTRLALAVASAPSNFDVVAFVPLVQITEVSLIFEAIQESLGLGSQFKSDSPNLIAKNLAGRKALIVLDNVEHLLPLAAKPIHDLLSACPGLNVLATSRLPLSIPGEQVVPIGPLDDLEAAAAMFMDRVALSGSGSESGDEAMEIAFAIAKELDGIPLAIELAAAHAGLLSLREIQARLRDRLGFLSVGHDGVEPRHARLGEVLAWSIASLPEETRDVFEMLSVFHGTFTAESASAVWGHPAESHLDSLRRRALIVEAPGARARRFRMLEPVRQFAEGRLDEESARRYRASVLVYLEDFYVRHNHLFFRAETAREANRVLLEEIENIRANLVTAFTEDIHGGLALATRLASLGPNIGHVQEPRRWLRTYLDAMDWPPSKVVAYGHFCLAVAAGHAGEDDLTLELLHRAAEVAKEADDPLTMALARTNRAMNLLIANRFAEARDEALAYLDAWPLDTIHNRYISEMIIIRADGLLGHIETARSEMEALLQRRLSDEGNVWTLSEAWFGVCQLAVEAHDFEKAITCCRKGLAVLEEGGYATMIIEGKVMFASTLLSAGLREETLEVVRDFEEIYRTEGVPLWRHFACYFRGALTGNVSDLVEASRSAVDLTKWIWASRAMQELARQSSDGTLAKDLLRAAKQVRDEHGIELSVTETCDWDRLISTKGISSQPVNVDDVLSRASS